MARSTPRLTVLVSPRAIRDLDEIWEDNQARYTATHADKYLDFLEAETDQLATEYSLGKPVPDQPDYRCRTFRKGRGGGFVVIFRVKSDSVEVLRYVHTARDWHGMAKRNEL